MKKTIFGLVTMLAFFSFSCQNANEKTTETTEQETEQTEATTNDAKASCCSSHVESCEGTITVDKVLEGYEEMTEEISVCGKVTHTCVHSGKRLFLAAENSEDILVVTTEDKFSEELVGQKVIVTGKIVMTEVEEHKHAEGEEHIEDDQHHKAHQKNYVLESSSCKVCKCKAETADQEKVED